MPTRRITDSALVALDLTLAKRQCEIEAAETTWDDLITVYIGAARRMWEGHCRRTMLPVTWELVQDTFTDALALEYPLVTSVTSVKYVDLDGIEQTLDPADYQVDTDSQPGWVVPAYGVSWPETRDQANAVRVRYVAGTWPDVASIDANVRLWMLAHVAHFFRNRESATPENLQRLPALDALIDEYTAWGFR